MIVNNFNIVGIAITPDKAQAPLVVNPYAMLASPIARQRFQPIARRLA